MSTGIDKTQAAQELRRFAMALQHVAEIADDIEAVGKMDLAAITRELLRRETKH